jgi:RNA-binding protein Nova
MQLSRAGEFYPGAAEGQDRVLLVSGTVDQLLTALHLVLTKLAAEPAASRAVAARDAAAADAGALQLRMLVHARLCGTLIGRGGATIRSFNEDSRAAFSISPPPEAGAGPAERVVRISGGLDELMRAVALVVTKLSENPDYHLLTDANLSYGWRGGAPGAPAAPGGASGGGGPGGGGPGGVGGLPGGGGAPAGAPGGGGGGGGGFAAGGLPDGAAGLPPTGGPAVTVTLAIPEDRVGVVIGRAGAVINQIKGLVNVSVRISRKGEHLPGTGDRACQISGAPEAVELAQRLILQKVHEAPRP